MRSIIIILLLSLPATKLLSQSFAIEAHINQLIQQGDESQNQQYYNLLIYYYENPLDINKASAMELSQLAILNQQQIDEIIGHIRETGPFLKLYELQSLPSLNQSTIKQLLPFVSVSKTLPLGKVFKGLFGRSTNFATLGYSRVVELSKAYRDNIYIGSPDRAQMRLRLRNPGHLSIGLTGQKDPGEALLTRAKIPGTDYLSAHIFLENQGRVRQLVIGDYRLQFGQGLVLGAGFMVGKNIETVTSIKQSNLGILPYSSITETNFFRGSGLTIGLTRQVNLTMFYSNQNLDATLVKDSTLNAVTSIRTSGLHRTSAEIAAANQLHEQVWGSAVVYKKKNFSTGLLLVNTQFDKPLIPTTRKYNQFSFTGKRLLNYSWFGHYRAGNFLLFSEVAKTHGAGLGLNLGLVGSISKYVSISMLYRSFAKDFHSLYDLAFSERSAIGNENGLYWGIKLYPVSGLTISAYYDMYRFPWLTSATAAPANGNDYLLRLEYKINEFSRAFIQLRNETALIKENNGIISNNQQTRLLKAILNFDYNLENPLTFRTRIQFNKYTKENAADGWLIYQDVNYDRMKVGITGRILFFDTESWGARQYVYEKDMLFTFNTKVYNGQGVSYYLIMKYKPLRNLSIRAKWAYIEYLNQNTIGSGNDTIAGNKKTQLTAQIHFAF